jgi:hypothetical protein
MVLAGKAQNCPRRGSLGRVCRAAGVLPAVLLVLLLGAGVARANAKNPTRANAKNVDVVRANVKNEHRFRRLRVVRNTAKARTYNGGGRISHTDPPPPPPPPGDGFAGLPFSGGSVVASDYPTSDNPIPAWHYVTDGYQLDGAPYDPAADPQISYGSTGGDPLSAFDGAVHPGYRHLQTDGPQSIWDAANQLDQTRAQVGGWSSSEAFHWSPVGTRELIGFSVRLDPNTQLPYPIGAGGGNTKYSQVFQIKSVGSGSTSGSPLLSMTEGSDGLKMVYNYGGTLHEDWDFSASHANPLPRGKWLRFALDISYSNSSSTGAYKLWGDVDGDNVLDFKPLTPRYREITVAPGFSNDAMNLGPYHNLSLPRNGRDYANVEILRHPASDPW